MIIKNKQIDALLSVINYPMKFSLARKRDKFAIKLSEHFDAYNKDIHAIKVEFCDKDEAGKPVINDGIYQFTEENEAEANKEYKILTEETFEIEADSTIHDIIQNSTVELGIGEAEVIDTILNQTKEAKVKKAPAKSKKK